MLDSRNKPITQGFQMSIKLDATVDALSPLYGFLVVKDKATGISIIDSSSEAITSLTIRIQALNLFSSYMEFSYKETTDLPLKEPNPLPGSLPINNKILTTIQKAWASTICQEVSEKLYEKSLEENKLLPYPLFSVLYKVWAKKTLSPTFQENGAKLKTHLHTLEGFLIFRDCLSSIVSFLKTHPVDTITLQSACLSLSLRNWGLSAEEIELQIYHGLGVTPQMAITSHPYKFWSDFHLKDSNKELSNALILEVLKITKESDLEESFHAIASLIGENTLQEITFQALCLTLSSIFPTLSIEEVTEKLQSLILLQNSKTSHEETSREDDKSPPSLGSLEYKSWAEIHLKGEDKELSDALIIAIETRPTNMSLPEFFSTILELFPAEEKEINQSVLSALTLFIFNIYRSYLGEETTLLDLEETIKNMIIEAQFEVVEGSVK